MRTIFDELRNDLDKVELWLDAIDQTHLTAAQRELADTLRQYIRHCRRDGRKWRSAAVAGRAITKVAKGWAAIWTPTLKQ